MYWQLKMYDFHAQLYLRLSLSALSVPKLVTMFMAIQHLRMLNLHMYPVVSLIHLR